MGKKILIVGGVAGGASAAARLRRLDESSEIIMFERGEFISFANCGLPYYIGGVIQERSALVVQTVEATQKKFNIDIRNFSEVVKIDREKKSVQVKNLKTGEVYDESYDNLILSPGASPVRPPIPGIETAQNIFTLRNIPDTDAIKNCVDEQKPRNAVVVGAGFIGLEMAENLHAKGIHVTIVEMLDQVMAPIDFEMASILHGHIQDKGVELILSDGVKSFEDNGKKVVLNSGKVISADMIILSIGIRPENQLAVAAGLEIGERGGIRVDEYLRTSDENIYAIGDAIEVKDYVSGFPTLVPLAWPANRQGRSVADNIYGKNVRYKGTLGTSVAKVFDMTVASTGNNEKTLRRIGADYKVVHIHPGAHAGYYPGAFPVSLKMTFDPKTGKIYGVQGVGYAGVEKRIDVVATAIKGGLTVFDLQELELAYAPPYSSAKDPVNMLGYVASNIVEGSSNSVQWHEIDSLISDGALLIDVSEPHERDMGFIKGSVGIPLGQLRSRLSEIPKDKPVYVMCRVGLRGYLAERILKQNGYNAINLDGGYRTYSSVYPAVSDVPESKCPIEVDDTGTTHPYCGDIESHIKINACGLQCPGPITKLYSAMNEAQDGQILEISVTDPGFAKDVKAWANTTGNTVLKTDFVDNTFKAYVMKGRQPLAGQQEATLAPAAAVRDGATIVVFSGEMDKALASFIIASGAAAMGKKVTMFFTFWGLNVLRKQDAPAVEKDTLEKMFGMMMPKGPSSLPLSSMNMAGMGPKMIDYVMKKKNVDSLETMIENALELGVNLVACAMSMDIMGIKQEELIDGVEIGGVATYLGKTDDSNLNLFI